MGILFPKLVIATHNEGKLGEIAALLNGIAGETVSAGSLGLPAPAETGTSFIENARIKSQAAATASGLPALADDSGLEVAALGGQPGIHTADWAEREPGGSRDWLYAMGRVNSLLEEKRAADRSAAFVCALVLTLPGSETGEIAVEGRCPGSVTWPPRGERGFGYDPMFIAEGYDRTFAEIDPDEKHRISHRADAFAQLLARLRA